MPAQSTRLNLETRLNALNVVVTTKEHQEAVNEALQAANGDWPTALENLKDKLPAPLLQKVALAHALAMWSDDNIPVVTALAEQPDVTNVRDVALRFNVDKLTALVDPEVVPETTAGSTADEKKRNFAVALQHKLFATEPTAVLQRMVQEAEIPIADTALRAGVTGFLGNQPDFNMRTTSIYTALLVG